MRQWVGRAVVGLVGMVVVAAVVGAVAQEVLSRRDLAATPSPGELVDIGGHQLHLYCAGTGSPTVILDAGLGNIFAHWALVLPEVAAFTRVCSYDRAGFGYSELGPTPRPVTVLGDELERLIDRAGIERPVVLVGASMAGLHLRWLASRPDDDLAGALVLVDASHEDQGAKLAAVGSDDSLPWWFEQGLAIAGAWVSCDSSA